MIRRTDRLWISSARLITKRGKVYLVVKVKAKYAKKATLRAKVLGKRNRKLGAWTKKVKTNHKVTIKVSARARSARVGLVR